MNETAKFFIGIAMIFTGVLLGLYVGVWVCFVGGIIDVIQQVRGEHLSVLSVAWGIAKIFCAGLFGYLAGLLLVAPGCVMTRLL